MPVAAAAAFDVLDQRKWDDLLQKIKQGKCTPIVGPEIAFGTMESRAELAEAWAMQLEFPFEECHDLCRVAQFAATQTNPPDAKRAFVDRLSQRPCADLPPAHDPYRILATLPFPLYLTTNYDDGLVRALKDRRDRDPHRVVAAWAPNVSDDADGPDSVLKPDVANPLVFHLFGHVGQRESLVLTEDDFLEFLVNASRPNQIPAVVEKFFASTVLLFLGYRFRDFDFRILLQFIKRYLQKNIYWPYRVHLCLQVADDPHDVTPAEKQVSLIRAFCKQFCERMDIALYFGTSHEFLTELSRRWREFNHDD